MLGLDTKQHVDARSCLNGAFRPFKRRRGDVDPFALFLGAAGPVLVPGAGESSSPWKTPVAEQLVPRRQCVPVHSTAAKESGWRYQASDEVGSII